jgi:hypothetical protein
MARLSLSLQKHGLSFGDALNIVLFLLTIASLVVALIGVKLAKDTLADARAQEREARTQQPKSRPILYKPQQINEPNSTSK